MSDLGLLDNSPVAYERAAERFGLLSTVPRLRIMKALCEQELCVSALAEAVGLPQPGISQQLNLLYRAGMLSRRKQGSQVYYKAHADTGSFVCGAIESLLR